MLIICILTGRYRYLCGLSLNALLIGVDGRCTTVQAIQHKAGMRFDRGLRLALFEVYIVDTWARFCGGLNESSEMQSVSRSQNKHQSQYSTHSFCHATDFSQRGRLALLVLLQHLCEHVVECLNACAPARVGCACAFLHRASAPPSHGRGGRSNCRSFSCCLSVQLFVGTAHLILFSIAPSHLRGFACWRPSRSSTC